MNDQNLEVTKDATYTYYKSLITGRTVKSLNLEVPSINSANRLGVEAFFASDPTDTETSGNNPFEWGTPEFTAWASGFETERTAWIEDQHEFQKGQRYD